MELLRLRRIRGFHDNGFARVAADRDGRIDGDFPEERDGQALGGSPSPTILEDLGALLAVRTDEITHVLDDAKDRDFHFLEHANGFKDIRQRHILWCGDDHRSRHWYRLTERQLGIPGPRRQVDHQIIQFPPLRTADQLLEQLSRP